VIEEMSGRTFPETLGLAGERIKTRRLEAQACRAGSDLKIENPHTQD
jgi:hypothetical protein